MPPLIYPMESDDKKYDPCESLRIPTYTDTTPEPGHPSKTNTKEPTSEPNYDALLEPSTPRGGYFMGNLYPKDIVRYHKVSDQPRFVTLEEITKDDPWGDTWKIHILGQYESLETGEDIITMTNSAPQTPPNFEEAKNMW